MNDQSNDPTTSSPDDRGAAAPDPVGPTDQQEAPEGAEPPRRTALRNRIFRWRSLAAVGVAGLVLGAGLGVGTTLLVDDHDGPGNRHRGWSEQGGFDGDRGPGGGRDGRGGHHNAPPGVDQIPPGTAPQEQESEEPSTDGDTSS